MINIFSFKVGQVLDNGDLKVTSVIAGGHVSGNISSMGRRARGSNFARVFDTPTCASISRRSYAAVIIRATSW